MRLLASFAVPAVLAAAVSLCAMPAAARQTSTAPAAEAPPALPAPTTMTLVWRYWGNRLVEWTLPRGGEGRYVYRDGPASTFPVSEAQFDEFRALFAPYEGVRFACRRVITDGAYGSVIWSQEGHEDQSLNFDAGCVSGDASDVFMRLEQAEALLKTYRGVD